VTGPTTPQPPVVLTVAGSDSGGGAGLQADLRAFAATGVFGACAVTAVTVQDTTAVHAVHQVPTEVVVAQVRAVLADLPVAATKTGLLGSSATVAAVAELADAGELPQVVVDPVLAASSGASLADPGTVDAYRRLLVPAAAVVTPNLPEAAALAGDRLTGDDDAGRLARRLGELTDALVVVTGGHGADPDEVEDVAWDGRRLQRWRRRRVRTHNSHGTGCTFSAALAAGLASGLAPLAAAESAGALVAAALAASRDWRLGRGSGPIDPLGAGGR
jgi:hydroxymethylpyrimidine/phosphomethylpyrimidine kinase